MESTQTVKLVRDLWKTIHTPCPLGSIQEQVLLMMMVKKLGEYECITPQVSLNAIEEIEDFYERHVVRKGTGT